MKRTRFIAEAAARIFAARTAHMETLPRPEWVPENCLSSRQSEEKARAEYAREAAEDAYRLAIALESFDVAPWPHLAAKAAREEPRP